MSGDFSTRKIFRTFAARSTCGDRFVSNNDEGLAQSCDMYSMVVPAKRSMPAKPTALDLVRDKGMADMFRKRHGGVNAKKNTK